MPYINHPVQLLVYAWLSTTANLYVYDGGTCPLERLKIWVFKVISRLFWLLDMLKDIVRANHFEGLIVPTKKRCVIEFSFLV